MLITLGVALDTSPPASELLRGDTGDQENAERESRDCHIVTRPGAAETGGAGAGSVHISSSVKNTTIAI